MFGSVLLVASVFAGVFLFWLFTRPVSVNDRDHQLRIRRNVELYQARIMRLQDEFAKQFVTAEELEQETVTQGRQLLRDIESLNKASISKQSAKKWLWFVLPLPLLAGLLYWQLGAQADWQITQQLSALQQSQTVAEYQQRLEDVHQAIIQRLEQKPDNITYRIMLADYAVNQSDYTQAVSQYGVLAELMPDDDEVHARLAQAEYLRTQTMTALAAQNLDRALQLNPDNRTALGLQGIFAMEHGDYKMAVNAWQRLLNGLPSDVPEAEILRQGIAKAKAQLGDDANDQIAVESVAVHVALAEPLAQLDKHLVVYVYARAANGPAIPLAAQRLTVADLPVTVTLDDSKAMMAQMKLSTQQDVVIGARVSFSGQAIAQKGDYQAESNAVDWRAAKQVNLLIEKAL